MEIPLEIGGFEGREVIFITPGLFSAPKLIVDGSPVEGKKGRFLLEDNVGTPVEIKVKPGLFDPMPKLEVDGSHSATM